MSEGRVRVLTVTQTATDVVTLAEARTYLGVTISTSDDALITAQIDAAIGIAETFLSRDILAKTRVQTEIYAENGELSLYYPPIASVDTVTRDGDPQTLDVGYTLQGATDNPVIDFRLPANNSRDVGGARRVDVEYTTAGLDNQIIKQGVLSIVSDLYNEGKVGTDYRSILAPFKIIYI